MLVLSGLMGEWSEGGLVPALDSGPGRHFTGQRALALIEEMQRGVLPSKETVVELLVASRQHLAGLPSLVRVEVSNGISLQVFGDIHGQFEDLMDLMKQPQVGLPSSRNMALFNGDFVDRGQQSVEVCLALLALQQALPQSVFLNRGNHESLAMNLRYGFHAEVLAKYDERVFDLFQAVFLALPLAHVINQRVFVVHGGVGDVISLDEIARLDRLSPSANHEGVIANLLWSDPSDKPGISPSKRGAGVRFGPDVTEAFLSLNSLHYIIRSHEVKMGGYSLHHNDSLITVFSAPNYTGKVGNIAAVISLHPPLLDPEVHTFGSSRFSTAIQPEQGAVL